MSDGQIFALAIFPFVAFLATYAWVDNSLAKYRKLAVVWIVFWMLPPLAALFIKGVFG